MDDSQTLKTRVRWDAMFVVATVMSAVGTAGGTLRTAWMRGDHFGVAFGTICVVTLLVCAGIGVRRLVLHYRTHRSRAS